MKLIVVRHGQTPWNTKSKLQGREADRIYFNELEKKGRDQARKLARTLKESGENIDLIISSPLKRAKGTAKIIKRKLKIKNLIYDSRLKDRGYGEFSGTTRHDFGGKGYSYKDFWDYNKNIVYPNGAENIKEFEARIKDFIDDCYKNYPDKTILLVVHVSGTKMINCLVGTGIPENGIISGNGLNNGGIAKYTVNMPTKREEFMDRIHEEGRHQKVNLRRRANGRGIIRKHRNREK